MDDAGSHARRRAAHQDEATSPPYRSPNGHFRPVKQIDSIEDVHTPARPTYPNGSGDASVNPRQTGYPFVRQPSPPLSQPSAVERSQILKLSKRFMNPYLQFICGPLLRYDNVDEHNVWRGAVLVVTVDSESTYDPHPTLKYCWDSQKSASPHRQSRVSGVDLGPHPADPMALHYGSQADDEHLEGPNVIEREALGTEIHVYSGRGGTYTFWRFLIQIQLTKSEMKIQYSINDGLKMYFFVPGYGQTMRLAAYSCNGFSATVNPDDFRGPGFQSGYDPVWVDLLAKHAEQPFHLLVGGGDQIYCDRVVREPEIQKWLKLPKPEDRKRDQLTDEMRSAIDRYYFNHYCQTFRSGAFARANSSIPMLNMLDDHDLIDGFGSYPDDLQKAPVFNAIGSRGYLFFLLFQCFIKVTVDGTNDRSHVFKSVVIGDQGPYVPFPSHSFLTPIGPTAWMLMLDCRAERTREQVCSEKEYTRVEDRLKALPPTVEHLIIQLGVPILYPRMVFLETALSSKFFPSVALRKLGFGRIAEKNKFNGDAELLDDLNDHWTSKYHKKERNQFIKRLQGYAQSRRIRISFLSGDVHCAAVSELKTLKKGWRSPALAPALDHRYMLNVVTSSIVNKPLPHSALTKMRITKRHRTMHDTDTDEKMVPLFDKDTDGSKPKSRYIMGRRNWCSITLEQSSGGLLFDIRVEKEMGHGETIGYSKLAPPPRWTPKPVERGGAH